ncbi:flagellar export protein FliJ [Sphaerotilus sp.]|uniref:flagellar export protein FliJ n=1 Tax=Sphaerotilus sp. TaxID=2093942 RepID=UPI002ACEBEFA|nr:flagellar FliJ family protein [Sphaerotilus sp.]MDZ7857644.1 flagellar FliJ family protein [Sphaerotilus sp.]
MTQALVTLLEHAERQRDQALARQRRADEVLSAAVQQQAQLTAYRHDHQTRWSAAFSQSVAVPLLHCHHTFSDRLHDAVDLQSGQVDRARQTVAKRQVDTLEAERRVAAIGKLMKRRADVASQHQHRQEQRQSDERSARAAWARTNESGHNSW